MVMQHFDLPEDLKPVETLITGPGAKLAKLTKSLCELIARETSFLRERKTSDAQLLHGEKSRLMAEYKNTMNQLQVNEKLLGEKDSDERKYLKFLTDKLREILRDHARIVLRLKSVAEGLIKSVGDEIAKQHRPIVSYSKTAAYQVSKTARPMSLSLNQVIWSMHSVIAQTPLHLVSSQNAHIQPTSAAQTINNAGSNLFALELMKASMPPVKSNRFLPQHVNVNSVEAKPSVFMPGIAAPVSQNTTSARSSINAKKKRRNVKSQSPLGVLAR